MLKNIILTTFSLASIFGINLIYFNNDVTINSLQKKSYESKNNLKVSTQSEESVKEIKYIEEKKLQQNTKKNNSIEAYIRSLKQEADLLISKEKYQKALEAYDKIIEITKKSINIKLLKHFAGAYFSKASIYNVYLNDNEKSILMLDEIAKRFKNSADIEGLRLFYKALNLKAQLTPLDKNIKLIYDEILDVFRNRTDKESIKIYIDTLRDKSIFVTDKEELMEIYNDIIERTKYSNDKGLLTNMIYTENEKADLLAREGNIEGAVKSYDEIIERFDGNDMFFDEVSNALFAKSYRIASINQDESLEALDKIIDREQSKNNLNSKNFEYSVINALELAIIQDIDDSKYENLITENFSSKHDVMAEYEMLKILQNAQYENQDNALLTWESKYKDHKFNNWDFSNLENWTSGIKNPEVKSRIKNYLNYFRERV